MNSSEAISLRDLSTRQLEELLAQRRLQEEEQLLSSGNVGTNVVTAQETDATKVVGGPTIYIPVKVSGVLVEAMVDTGSQSSIIS